MVDERARWLYIAAFSRSGDRAVGGWNLATPSRRDDVLVLLTAMASAPFVPWPNLLHITTHYAQCDELSFKVKFPDRSFLYHRRLSMGRSVYHVAVLAMFLLWPHRGSFSRKVSGWKTMMAFRSRIVTATTFIEFWVNLQRLRNEIHNKL